MNKKILGVLLTLVILTSSVYYLYGDDVKISIEKTRTKYFIDNDGWELAATEYVNIYSGTTKMRAKSRELESWNDSHFAYTRRTSYWKDNITSIQTYTFSRDSEDIEQFPLKNEFQCINCEDKIVHYEIRDILYDGVTKQITSPFSFGNRMKIEWDDGNYYSKVFQQISSDKIIIKYRPQDNDEIYSVRLFDPPTFTPVNPSFEIGSPFTWAGTGGVGDRQSTQAHTGTYGARILQTGGVNTLLYQNLTSLNLTNGTSYIASAWIYIPSGQGEPMHGELAMGSAINTQDNRRTYGNISTVGTTDTWMQINLTFIYDNSTDLYFDMFADGSVAGGGYVYWDDAYILNEPSSNISTSGDIYFNPQGVYSDSLWMLTFSLDGATNTPYSASCGATPTSPTDTISTIVNGSYALSWSGQNSYLGNSEKQRFGLWNFPRFFYANTYRIFMRLNDTTNAVTSFNLNTTEILDRTGITTDINTSTYRIYRINANGGVYNDTGICLEQPVSVQ